jgi:hypothetical protein
MLAVALRMENVGSREFPPIPGLSPPYAGIKSMRPDRQKTPYSPPLADVSTSESGKLKPVEKIVKIKHNFLLFENLYRHIWC